MASVVIVAAGSGTRMNSSRKKQFLKISGKTILAITLARFDKNPDIDTITLVVPPDEIDFCISAIIPEAELTKPVNVVPGGKERHESVRLGLGSLPKKKGIVLIHDGVRPFVSDDIISHCISGASRFGACIPVLPVSDTVKLSEDGNFTSKTIPRSNLWLAQTPQAFDFDLIHSAHIEAAEKGFVFTDDASLMEEIGRKVKLIIGSRFNIKITAPEDLPIAEAFYSLMSLA